MVGRSLNALHVLDCPHSILRINAHFSENAGMEVNLPCQHCTAIKWSCQDAPQYFHTRGRGVLRRIL